MNLTEAAKITSNIGRHYYRFEVAKKTGGRRVIVAPSETLKKYQKYILKELETHYIPTTCSMCCKKRGIVPNAQCHVGRRVILKLDIKNFFDSITRDRVRQAFIDVRISDHLLDIYSDLCTFRNKLPTGSPVSPLIASMVCRKLDEDMVRLANNTDAYYTRYVDDLTFSSDSIHLNYIIPDVRRILEQHRFKLNNAKVKVMRNSNSQIVTGVSVNEKVNIPRYIVRNFRARVHKLLSMSPGQELSKELNAIVGYIAYFRSINSAVADKYMNILKSRELI